MLDVVNRLKNVSFSSKVWFFKGKMAEQQILKEKRKSEVAYAYSKCHLLFSVLKVDLLLELCIRVVIDVSHFFWFLLLWLNADNTFREKPWG